ncbi:MAG: hypothetical protein UHN47_05680 [Lachnospiraceae bacterium]|nr:hypothetical protein [Lachnospiraceae bacterium]
MLSLEEKLQLWIKITGINPNEEQKRYTIYFNDRLSDYDIRQMDEKIREALGYDKTGLFAEAYLCHFFKRYIKQRGFHLDEYIANPSIKEYLDDVCLLNQELQESDAEKLISEEAHKAMAFYGLKSHELTVFDIAEIRTCANNCIDKNLHTLQFSTGPTQKDGFKMSKEIRMYQDLNALILSAAKGNVDGVSMAYIRDEKEITHSYFSFVIKNGKNLYLLTDKPIFAHPLQSTYSRCPGRDMSRRIEGNLFPYDTVANIDVSDLWDSGRYGTKEKGTNLSTILRENNGEEKLFEVIGTIDSLEQAEAFWFILMISLIKEKFYDKEVPQLTLSYTGNQIQHPAIEKTENALVVQSTLPSLSMERITFADIEDITFDHYYEEHYKSDWNYYLVERYKDRISEDVLNILNDESILLLPNHKHSKKRELHPFDIVNECGTSEELRYRQKWIGRYNYAKFIKACLQKDYDENCTKIYDDIKHRIETRLEDIVIMFLQNKLVDRKAVSHHTFDHVFEGEEVIIGKIISFDKWWSKNPSAKYQFGNTSRHGNKADYRCSITGDAPGVVLYVKPSTIYALCQICKCEVSDLPVFIQHWSKSRHYCGNPNLSNIDPVAYLLKDDPFNDMEFSISIVLSKKEYLRLCGIAEVEAKKFWLEEKPLCLAEDKEICYGDWKYDWEKGNLLKKKCIKCKYYKENVKQSQEE